MSLSRNRWRLARCLAALLAAGLPALNSASAATITWGAATTIAGDADVSTAGTAVYAYDQSNVGATVNGVAFATGSSTNSLGGGQVTMAANPFGAVNNTTFGSDSGNPWNSLSSSYQSILKGAAYSGNTTVTVTLNNLFAGHRYQVQVWVHDNRGSIPLRNETLTSGANTVSLTYNSPGSTAGAVGQYVLGTFTADGTSQSFTLLGGASTQLNALQLRDVTPPAYFSGVAGTVWDAGTTASWSTNSGGPYNQTWTAASGVAAAFEGVAANVNVSGAVSVHSILFNTDGYTINGSGTLTLGGYGSITTGAGSDTIGAVVAGSAGLSKQGGGTLTLTNVNTYTGPTAIGGGTLAIGGAGRLGSGTYATNTVNNGTFSYNSTALQTLSGVMSGAGNLTQSAGTLTLSGANTFTGNITVNGGKLRANLSTATLNASSGALGNGQAAHSITINNGGTVELFTANVFGDQKGSPQVSWVINAGGLLTQSTSANRQNVLGNAITLNGGSISVGSGSSAQYCALALSGMAPTVTVGGSQASYITNAPSASNAGLALGTWNSVTTFNVADATGNSNPDLIVGTTLQNAVSADGSSSTQGVSCLVKTGAGTMKLTGALQVSGFISVYDGTLDLASATVAAGMKINLVGSTAVLIPPAGTTTNITLYLNNQKLAAGTWGASGSGAQNTSAQLGGTGILTQDSTPSRRDIWKTLKYGIFSHYTYAALGDVNLSANAFNATAYANDVAAAGAQYVVWTAWHGNMFPMFPSQAAVRYGLGGRCSTRDTVSDMIDAVKAKGLRVYLYTHPFQPVSPTLEIHNNYINELYAEVVERYGSRIDGLWIDENQIAGDQDSLVDYKRLLKNIRQRNPDIVTMHNGGQMYTTDMGGPECVGNWNFGWSECMYNLLNPGNGPDAENMVRTMVLEAASNFEGGGVHWSVDGKPYEGLVETNRVYACGQYLAPIMISITNTRPSTAFPPPYHNGRSIGLGDSNWFATESGDKTKAFIHVLTAPGGNTLNLPAPADGKTFTNATLLASLQVGAATQQVLNAAVTLVSTPRGLQLTLTGTNTWSALDTVIQLDVGSQGGTGMVNDSSPNVTYTGNSWSYQPHRGLGEYADDAHTATANGDAFTLTFSGTEVSLISSRAPDRGGVDLYLDDVLQTNVDLSVGVTNRDVVFTKSGLPRGQHTLKGVKTSGTSLVVDAFRVIEMVNDSDIDLSGSYPNTLGLGSGSAGYSGSGWQPGYNGVGWITPNVAYEPSRSLTDTNPPSSPYFTFGFTGSGAQCFLSSAYSWAYFFITVDGVFQTNLRVSAGSVSTFTVTNLPMGNHTIQGITWKATTDPSQPGVNSFTVTRPDMWIYQTNRNLGEYGNDVHYSDVNGPFNYPFTGSGVDVFVSRDENARMTWYGVNGMGTSTGARRQNYSESFQAGGSVFGLPNLVPGSYTVTAQNGANNSGMNFSYVRLNIDALRIYKGESLSGTPLLWGATGAGGSGTWDIATTANWNDGTLPTKWFDFGGLDYAALFQGTAGTVSLATNVNVNRLTFNTSGYTLQNNTLTLSGSSPTINSASNVITTINSVVAGSAGLNKTGVGTVAFANDGVSSKTGNTFTGGTVIAGGTISISGRSADNGGYTSLGTGPVTVNAGCTLVSANDWATGNEWNSGAVGKITLNAGMWTINAAGSTVRNGLELNGGVINGTGANADWGGLYLRNTAVTVGGNAVSSIGVDTALNANTTFTVGAGSQLNYGGKIHNTIGTTGAITKLGPGTLLFNSTNIYTGSTIVSEGTLGGTGSIKGPVTIQSGAILSPGASIGTLSVSNTLTLQSGSQTLMEINAALGTNDLVRGITTVNYGGTLVLTNVAGTVSAGQTFKLFSATSRTGNFSAITPTNAGSGLVWSFNPTNGVLTALATVALNPTNITASVTGTNLTLTWPADHTGWTLLQQTNNLIQGISADTNDWTRLTSSAATNNVVIPILPTQPAGYFRLVYP